MTIIIRSAIDDFDAFLIAQCMENAGATVFSVAFNGTHRQHGALIDSSRFIVFAKYDEPVTPDLIDEAIEKAQAKPSEA